MLDVSSAKTRDARLDALLLYQEVNEFNAAYAAALDEQRLIDWVEMFTEDAFYVVISRENADHGLPVGLIYCDSKRMIHDRAFALEKTTMFAPRYLRHIIGNLQVLGEAPDGAIRARANYVLIQVLYDRPEAKLHQVGAYHDVFRRVDGALKLAERRCIYDSLLIDNALCLPALSCLTRHPEALGAPLCAPSLEG
jgi:anthranilate 1,2-dioxygenase small subunit